MKLTPNQNKDRWQIEAVLQFIAKTELVDDRHLRDYLRDKEYDLNQNLVDMDREVELNQLFFNNQNTGRSE